MYHWVKFFYVKIKMMFKIIKFTKNYNIYKNCTKITFLFHFGLICIKQYFQKG